MKFLFHDNAYEISFKDLLPGKSIPYNEFLTNEDIMGIVNSFSKNLMKSVNMATNI